MKAEELRKKDNAALQKELVELLKEQFNLRMQNATAQLTNHAQIRKVRRQVAKVKTIMAERSKGESA